MGETITTPYSQIANVPILDYIRTAVIVFTGLPVSIVSIVRRRLFSSEKVAKLPLGQDLVLSLARWVALRLPLSVLKRFGHRTQKNIDKILDSPRFQKSKEDLCEEVVKTDFSGFWICKGAPGQQPRPPSESDIVWLDFHGGAYYIGHPLMKLTHYLRIAEIVADAGKTMSIFSGRYFLAPDAHWPTQQNQALAAYRYLIEDMNVQPTKIVIGGDSAGGHLAIALLVAIAEAGLPKPSGALLICPWVDLTNSGISFESNQYLDGLSKASLDKATQMLLGSRSDYDEVADSLNYAAPRDGKLAWKDILPSITVATAGSYETLLSGCTNFYNNAKKEGMNVELDVVPNRGHCWQWHVDWSTEKAYLSLTAKDIVKDDVMIGSQQVGGLMLQVIKGMEVA